MAYSRWVFWIAGIYGLIVLSPQYFLEAQIGRDLPPPITHPEYFYGFAGVALSWQFAFLVIGQAPHRYRPLMIPAVLEKFSFAIAACVLFAQQRLPTQVLAFGLVDLVLGVLFLIAFFQCRGGEK